MDSDTTATTEPIDLSDGPSANRLWDSVIGFLRPVLAPRITEVLLSPLLVVEVVARALLTSGSALLLPVAALGGGAGWAYSRWAPMVDHSEGAPSTGFLAGWKPNKAPDGPTTNLPTDP